MQQTYQTRIHAEEQTLRWLNAFGELYGRLQRTLYAAIAKGENPNNLKKSFCAAHGISARHFNAIRIELQGKIDSVKEVLKLNRADIKRNIAGATRSLKKLDQMLARNPASIQLAKLQKQRFGKQRRLASQTAKLRNVETHLKAAVPGICFGSRKLFNQQFHLDQTDFHSHDDWKKAWQASRAHQFFLVGSKDETGGNQSCKAKVAEDGTLSLTIKMPAALIKQGAPAFLKIDNIAFTYGQERVLQALQTGTALSYRFHRDSAGLDGWRIFVSTDVAEAPKESLSPALGAVGIDFNADHLAWARTDRFGNAIEFGREELSLHGKTTHQRDAILSEALDKVFAVAKAHSLSVSIEYLDFAVKKKELQKMGEKRARMLSGLAYAKYRSLAQAKTARTGVQLTIIDPAYTSVAGSIKYAVRQGRTMHQAAAGVIARRAQGYSEKLPKQRTIRAPLMGRTAVLSLPVRNRVETPRTSWASLRKCLTQHCAELVRIRRNSSLRRKNTSSRVSRHQLNEGITPSSREPGELLARRTIQLSDVPF